MGYVLREALANFRRLWRIDLLAIGVIVVSCFLVGTFYLLTANLLLVARNAQSRLMEMEVYLSDDMSEDTMSSLAQSIKAHPAVGDVEVIDKARAAAEFSREFGPGLVDALSTNPLPPSIRLHLRTDPQIATRADEVAAFLKGKSGVDEVVYQKEWSARLSHLVSLSMVVDLSLFLVVALSSVLVVYSAVRLSILHRRPAVEVMRLIGATEGLIRRPFVVGGLLYGGIGGFLAAAMLYVCIAYFRSAFPEWSVAYVQPALWLSGAAGICLAAVSSWFSARKVLARVE